MCCTWGPSCAPSFTISSVSLPSSTLLTGHCYRHHCTCFLWTLIYFFLSFAFLFVFLLPRFCCFLNFSLISFFFFSILISVDFSLCFRFLLLFSLSYIHVFFSFLFPRFLVLFFSSLDSRCFFFISSPVSYCFFLFPRFLLLFFFILHRSLFAFLSSLNPCFFFLS